MRKSKKVLLAVILVLTLSTSLSASSLIRDIAGKENKGITIKYNNQVQNLKDGNGSAVYPVIINGSTYLPVRAIADMLGEDISWDGDTKTIYIGENGSKSNEDGSVPTDLPSTRNKNENITQPQKNTSKKYNSSNNAGTLQDPIKLGTTYSYNCSTGWENNIANADYDITITNVKPITIDDIVNLGFERPEDNALIEYAMITMKVDVTNATYEGNESYWLNMYDPNIYDIKNSEGNYNFIYKEYGFNGSLDEAIDIATKTSGGTMLKVYPNESKSYSAEGNMIVGLFANSNNCIGIQYGESYNDIAYFEIN